MNTPLPLTHTVCGTQIRKSPFFDATLRYGCRGFSVYNHMYIPRDFGDPVQNYWNLVQRVILCDVSVERQVEITGPDAYRFVRTLTPRNLESWDVRRCKYALITDEHGGIINDPVMLRLDENHFWISVADSDVLLWAKGVAVHSGMEVHIREPDVSPLQLQGPYSIDVLKALVGGWVEKLKYYELARSTIDDIPVVLSRTGWSSEKGYEIYLTDCHHGDRLWERIMEAGRPFDIAAGHTSMIRRIEGGMLSYHADMTIENDPFELNLEHLVDVEQATEFVGKAALKRIEREGVSQKLVGLRIDGPPLSGPNESKWPVLDGDLEVGYVTSAVYSPRLDQNIALAMLRVGHTSLGAAVRVRTEEAAREAGVVRYPFVDPDKQIPKSR
ncbi:MAG: glycine cleavage T C-terminal barrel domain-containing protein [Gammaproteobacteria bacterium]